MNNKEYSDMTARASEKSNVFVDCINAFWVGGLICVLGQLLHDWYTSMGIAETIAATCVSASLVTISIILTGLNIYPKISKFAGAGTLVPITGFANAMAAPAIEFKTEGMVLGLGAKIFTIAGPVILYGVTASVIYGIIYYIWTMF